MARKRIASNPCIQDFVDVARRYCHLIDSVSKMKKRDFVFACAAILPELQYRAVGLLGYQFRSWPDAPKKDDGSPDDYVRDYFRRGNRLDRKFGKDHGYHHLFNPYEEEEKELTWYSLGYDLADIYHDLKEGLDLFGEGDESHDREAVWQWGFTFMTHWGGHCVSAMRPIHELTEKYRMDSWGIT